MIENAIGYYCTVFPLMIDSYRAPIHQSSDCAVKPNTTFNVVTTHQETAAAIKIQAAYRRRRIMGMMEEEGQTTAAVRNMARRRQAAKEASTNPAQDFIDLFNCCGVDLGLGAGNKEAYFDYTRELETAKYNETRRETAEREELLRKKYQRKPPRESLVENVEVVQ